MLFTMKITEKFPLEQFFRLGFSEGGTVLLATRLNWLGKSSSTEHCTQKMKFSIEDFFSKCDKNRSFLQIWPHLLKKSWMEKFIFRAVEVLLYLLWITILLSRCSIESLHRTFQLNSYIAHFFHVVFKVSFYNPIYGISKLS